MIILQSDRLRVEISEPMERPNDRFRFDRSGYISEVVLDGERHFCANEPKNLVHPSSGGRGLCSEIQCDLSQEHGMDERYPKFGVGLLPNDGSPYLFHRAYKNVVDFPISFQFTKNTADFIVEAIPCGGYALREKKHIAAESNQLSVTYTMTNVGSRDLTLTEYCHNFLSVDGMAVSPAYHLSFPSLKDFGTAPVIGQDGTPQNLTGEGHGFTFSRTDTCVSLADIDMDGMCKNDGIFRWRLSHDGAKAYVEGCESFLPDAMTIWASDHMVSPEIMHTVQLAPGETKTWSRSWHFDEISRF